MDSNPVPRFGALVVTGLLGVVVVAGLASVLFVAVSGITDSSACDGAAGAGGVVLGPPGQGRTVGASEYGGPGDPSSGTVGSSGANLDREPDSYAELGGDTFGTAVALGGLPYDTPLRVTWGNSSAIAYKRDIGLGGGPVAGHPRVIDLWWELARGLGIPYEDGDWSGAVRIAQTPLTGAATELGDLPAPAATADPTSCTPGSGAGVPITSGSRATLLDDGRAAAPADAPTAVKEMIAAGNQIVGKPYVYGGGHGLPLTIIAPSYDCSSSIDHILYGAGLLPVAGTETSGELESFGAAGPGRWVTLYASADHVFMYVAGLRWDTHNAAGPADGGSGIGWHPLVRSAAGFVARHPVGL